MIGQALFGIVISVLVIMLIAGKWLDHAMDALPWPSRVDAWREYWPVWSRANELCCAFYTRPSVGRFIAAKRAIKEASMWLRLDAAERRLS